MQETLEQERSPVATMTPAVPEDLRPDYRLWPSTRGLHEASLQTPLCSWQHSDPAVSGWQEFLIRTLDVVGSLLILFVLWPVTLVLAATVKLTSAGPVFYSQGRVGRYGKVFTMYKFRTMKDGAESDTGPVLASTNDTRLTPVGQLLRQSRMDELPQLFNVLRGDMSMVGPRPERPHFVQQYRVLQGVRLAVKPGITGLAQIRGSYNLRPERKVRYDTLYIQRRSVLLNLYVLMQTIPVILMREGQ